MAGAIWAVTEVGAGGLKGISNEVVACGQKLAQALGKPLEAVVIGSGARAAAEKVATKDVTAVRLIDDPALDPYTPDAFTAALRQAIQAEAPELVLFPHTYQVRDFAPKLAAGFQRSLISDCVALRIEGAQTVFIRQMFQGKTNADVVAVGAPPVFASFQAGAFRADHARDGAAKVEAKRFAPSLDAAQVRSNPEEPFREARQAVDLTQAERIVAVGRGIKEPQNLEMAKKLAALLGAELAASRPICDEGWLPMERQIGSSGQTVAPKLYLAVGISGAIQHVVGMKGSRTVVAINKDANAPIFEIADYGIVGDLFEIVPALIDTLEKG